jgi:hypothetical protein
MCARDSFLKFEAYHLFCYIVGGVCSTLLANIALHGLEQAITSAFPVLLQKERWKPTVIRYADDLVVLHVDKPFRNTTEDSLLTQKTARKKMCAV